MADGLSQTGRVVSVVAGEAVVALAAGGCSGCGQKSACGLGRLAGAARENLVRLPACDGLRAGDAVMLEAEGGALLRAALLGYLVPALSLVIGAVGGDAWLGSDAGAVAGAGAGFLGGLLVVRAGASRLSRHTVVAASVER